MTTLPIQPNQWRDPQGEVWTPRFTTSVLRRAASELGLSLVDLQSMDKANFGKLIGLAWFAVEKAARARGYMTQDAFEDACLPLPIVADALAAVGVALGEAFPTAQDQGGESNPAPLAETPAPQTRGEVQASRGNSETYSS